MEEYANNSMKAKNEEPERKVDKVVSGEVRTKKKSDLKKFADVFIAEDISNVGSYILFDVIVPILKKSVDDIFTKGLHMILYGEKSTEKKSSSGTQPSYRNYYKSDDRTNTVSTKRTAYSFDDILFDTRYDAEKVLDNMRDIIGRYGTVSVLDMYDLAGSIGNYTDSKYGWSDLRTAKVARTKDDDYIIELPRVLPL